MNGIPLRSILNDPNFATIEMLCAKMTNLRKYAKKK